MRVTIEIDNAADDAILKVFNVLNDDQLICLYIENDLGENLKIEISIEELRSAIRKLTAK